jgi:predicted PurR-regulated permease PerM
MAKEFSMKMNKSKVDISEKKQNPKRDFTDESAQKSSFDKTVKIEIPPKTIITVLLVVAGIYLLFQIVNVFIILFFAFVVASATLPLISGMIKKGFPKWLSISSVYLVFIAILLSLVMLIVSPFITETTKLAREIVQISEESLIFLDEVDFEIFGVPGSEIKELTINHIEDLSKEIVPAILGSAGVITTTIDTLMGVGGVLVILVSILIISIYIVSDHDRVVDAILIRVNDDEKRDRIRKLIVDVEHKLGRWLVGQGTVSLIVGFITWLILTIFGVPFALPIAVLAALLEVIPNLGPVLVSIPMFLLALLTGGPLIALFVVISYIILQQFQSYVLTPRIMYGVIGLHPLLIFVGMLTGFALAGIIGAALAIPSLVLIKIGFEFYKDLQKLKAKGIL